MLILDFIDRSHSLRSPYPPSAALPLLPIAGPVIVYGVSASVGYGLNGLQLYSNAKGLTNGQAFLLYG